MATREERESKRRQYDELFALVAAVINEWDPFALLGAGAPRDEFASEVSSIVTQVSRMKSATDAAHVISRVFASSFEPQSFTPETCRVVGERLYAQLEARGFTS